VQLDFSAREVTMKLVYYGPALSGKTTNLIALHERAGKESRGRLMTLETKNDRTLFFDLLPLTFKSETGDVRLRIKLFTVPGQPIHTSTRKLVLQGADGVALVADSRISETEHNAASFLDLRDNLKANGSDIAKTPLVIQFNKRDLPDIRTNEELVQMASRGKEPVFTAVARDGVGVLETFLALLQLTWSTLDHVHGLGQKLRVDGKSLLANAAQQLNAPSSTEDLLARRLGGGFDPVGVPPPSAGRSSGQRAAIAAGAIGLKPPSGGGPPVPPVPRSQGGH